MTKNPAEHGYSTDAKSWLQWADHTYAGARTLFHDGNFFLWFPAAILGHQALEMYLKAALIVQGHRVSKDDVWGHDLGELAKKLAAKVPQFPPEVLPKLKVFTDYFNELRYPYSLNQVNGLGEEEGYLLGDLAKTMRPYAMRQEPPTDKGPLE